MNETEDNFTQLRGVPVFDAGLPQKPEQGSLPFRHNFVVSPAKGVRTTSFGTTPQKPTQASKIVRR